MTTIFIAIIVLSVWVLVSTSFLAYRLDKLQRRQTDANKNFITYTQGQFNINNAILKRFDALEKKERQS